MLLKLDWRSMVTKTLNKNDKVKAFLNDLKVLLAKHKADIGFDCGDGSDLYGLYDEHVTAEIDGTKIRLVSGWVVDASGLP